MHPDVHRCLDGELPRAALTAAAEAELAEWETLQNAVLERRREQAPPWLADRVMHALAAGDAHARDAHADADAHAGADMPDAAPESLTTPLPARRRAPAWQRGWQWLLTPRPIRVPPLAPLAAAALVLVALLRPGVGPTAPSGPPAALLADAPVVYVQFTLNAAGASSVSVAGDFNNWSTETGTLRDADGNGVWTGMVAVRPGVHKYMFVVDGEEWVTDPVAESYVDDGFGMRNALLAVATPEPGP